MGNNRPFWFRYKKQANLCIPTHPNLPNLYAITRFDTYRERERERERGREGEKKMGERKNE